MTAEFSAVNFGSDLSMRYDALCACGSYQAWPVRVGEHYGISVLHGSITGQWGVSARR